MGTALNVARETWSSVTHVEPAWWDHGYHAFDGDVWLGNVELDGLEPRTTEAH